MRTSHAAAPAAMERAERSRAKAGSPPARHPLWWCYWAGLLLLLASPALLILGKERWFMKDAVVWFEDGQNLWRPEALSEWYYVSLWGLLVALLLFVISLHI